MTQQVFSDQVRQQGVPRVANHVPEVIKDADATVGTTYETTDVIDVAEAREVALLVKYSGDVADDELSLLVLLSASSTPPLAGDDSWYALSDTDGIATPAEPGGTIFSGQDMTLAPEWVRRVVRPLEIRLEKVNNATDEIRASIPVRTTWARYMCVAYRNVRAQSGTLTISVVRST